MIEKITNHVERAKRNLMSQYKDSVKFNELLEVLVNQFQKIEDALYDLRTLRYLDTAFGVQLDKIGEMVDIQRYGLDDNDYRKRIYGQIILNTSNGEPETLINALRLIMDATDIKYDEYYVGKINIEFASDKDAKDLPKQIDRLCLAGIKDVKLTQSDPLQPFEFAEVSLDDFQLIANDQDNIIVDSEDSEYNLYVSSGNIMYVDPDFALSDIFEEDGEIIEFQGGVLSECLNP